MCSREDTIAGYCSAMKELGEKTCPKDTSDGMDYSAVAVLVIRLVEKSKDDRALRKWMKHVAEKCQM